MRRMGRCLEWVSACFWSIHSFRGCTWSLRVFQSSLLQKCQLTGLAQGVKAPLLAFTARTTARTTTRPSGQAPRPVSILKVGFEDANALGHTHQVVQGVQAEAPPWNKHQPRKKKAASASSSTKSQGTQTNRGVFKPLEGSYIWTE